jgi:hypothetical protein
LYKIKNIVIDFTKMKRQLSELKLILIVKMPDICYGTDLLPSPPFFCVHSLLPVLSVVLCIHQKSPCGYSLLQ